MQDWEGKERGWGEGGCADIASELECKRTWKSVSLCHRSSGFSSCRCLPARVPVGSGSLGVCEHIMAVGMGMCGCLHIMYMFESVKSSQP